MTYRILLADSLLSTRSVLKKRLEQAGSFVVAQAALSSNVFAMLDCQTIDLVLLDISGENRAGMRILTSMKAHPRYKDIPVIVLATSSVSKTVYKTLALGAYDYFVKSVAFNPLLVVKINNALRMADYSKQLLASERRLRESEERYRSIIDQSSDGVYIYDPILNKIEEVNCRLAIMLGYSQQQMATMKINDFVNHTQQDIDSQIKLTMERGQYFLGRRNYRRSDGVIMAVEVTMARVCYQERKVVMVNVRDVSERNALEEKVYLAEAVFSETDDAIIITNADKKVIRVNPAFTAMTGFSPEDVLGRDPSLLIADIHDEAFLRASTEELEATGVWRGEMWLKHKNGGVVCTWRSLNVIRDDQGKTLRYIGISSDITSLKEAQLLSQEKEQSFRLLMEQSSDGVFMFDPDTQLVLEVNNRFTEMVGYDWQELIGKPLQVFIPYLPAEVAAKVKQLRLTGRLFWGIRQYRGKDGLEGDMELNASLVNVHGKDVALVNVRDISERRRLEDRMFKDMALAVKVQGSFLPPDIDYEQISIRSIYKPYYDISGDLYGYKWLDGKQRLFGYVLDVAGHGMATSLRASALTVLLRQVAERPESLADRLTWVNSQGGEYFSEDTFAAVICFELDFCRHTLTYAAAGITYFLSSQGRLDTPGLFLGIHSNEVYEQQQIPFGEGDCFYFFSDGIADCLTTEVITEIKNADFDKGLTYFRQIADSPGRFDDATCIGLRIGRLE